MKNDVNTRAASASNLINAVGFEEFMSGVKNYSRGAQFSIPDALGDQLDNVRKNSGSLVTLGKLIRNNVENGNLSGLMPLQTLEGTAKKYKVVGEVKLKKYFSVDWCSHLEDLKEQISFDVGELFVFCTYVSKIDEDEVELCVYTKMRNVANEKPLITEYRYKKKLGNCGFMEINTNNQEFPAIQCVWYGFDRVAELERNGELNDIKMVYFIGPNVQMMRRVAGCYFGEATNMYSYTQYIQENFFQFLPDELRGISKEVHLASCDKAVLDKYIQKL